MNSYACDHTGVMQVTYIPRGLVAHFNAPDKARAEALAAELRRVHDRHQAEWAKPKMKEWRLTVASDNTALYHSVVRVAALTTNTAAEIAWIDGKHVSSINKPADWPEAGYTWTEITQKENDNG